MTFREKMLEFLPNQVNDFYVGGVCGCPSDFFEVEEVEECGNKLKYSECMRCWERECTEEMRFREKEGLENIPTQKSVPKMPPVKKPPTPNPNPDYVPPMFSSKTPKPTKVPTGNCGCMEGMVDFETAMENVGDFMKSLHDATAEKTPIDCDGQKDKKANVMIEIEVVYENKTETTTAFIKEDDAKRIMAHLDEILGKY